MLLFLLRMDKRLQLKLLLLGLIIGVEILPDKTAQGLKCHQCLTINPGCTDLSFSETVECDRFCLRRIGKKGVERGCGNVGAYPKKLIKCMLDIYPTGCFKEDYEARKNHDQCECEMNREIGAGCGGGGYGGGGYGGGGYGGGGPGPWNNYRNDRRRRDAGEGDGAMEGNKNEENSDVTPSSSLSGGVSANETGFKSDKRANLVNTTGQDERQGFQVYEITDVCYCDTDFCNDDRKLPEPGFNDGTTLTSGKGLISIVVVGAIISTVLD